MSERRVNRNYIRHLEKIEELLENGGGAADAVKYTEQVLTSEQQQQARTNIGAASESEQVHIQEFSDGDVLEPNIPYQGSSSFTGTIGFTFASIVDPTIENEYKFVFDTGVSAPTITWPSQITSWVGNCLDNGAPQIKGSKHYEVSVVDGYACIVEFDVQP